MHAYKDQNYAKKTIKLIDDEHTCELCQFTLAKDQGKNSFLKKVFYFVKTLVCLLSGVCAAATALKGQYVVVELCRDVCCIDFLLLPD